MPKWQVFDLGCKSSRDDQCNLYRNASPYLNCSAPQPVLQPLRINYFGQCAGFSGIKFTLVMSHGLFRFRACVVNPSRSIQRHCFCTLHILSSDTIRHSVLLYIPYTPKTLRRHTRLGGSVSHIRITYIDIRALYIASRD